MPAIRIMNWNIEKLSWNKIGIPGMAQAISATVFGENIDVLIIVEVMKVNAPNIMAILTTALDVLAGAAGTYQYFLSYPSGGEHYGIIIRNLNVIRPLAYAPNPNVLPADVTNGTQNRPFTNLQYQSWTTWPIAFPNALPPLPWPAKPRMGLTDVYATSPRARTVKKTKFGGMPIANGGYSLGRGYRLPCIVPLMIQGAAVVYLVPLIVCHYASSYGGRNRLAQAQVGQLKLLDAAQSFSKPGLGGPRCKFWDVDNVAEPVVETIFTGDFNLNFMQNLAGGTFIQSTNRAAYNNLTPTVQLAGSAAPAANAGAVPLLVPAVPFVAPFVAGPNMANVPVQALRAAATTEGTILLDWDPLLNPPNTLAIRGGALDNFMYGGAEPNTAVVNFGVGLVDSGDVIDVPANVSQAGAPVPPLINVAGPAVFYTNRGTKNAALAPSLLGGAMAPPLTVDDRWIGANLVSDHLPVILDFNCA
jgi:hypothetical protein